jgi:PAS domain S-box-containing protein
MNSMEQFPAKNPNPVLSVTVDGTVLFSNEAGETLLNEWGMGVGRKLPSSIGEIVQGVISRNSPKKMEVKVGKSIYSVVFHPLPEQECVSISIFNMSNKKKVEEKLREDEDFEIANIELAEIIDVKAIKPLMNDLFKLVHIPIGINDLKGNVLAGVGWQEICTKFHRVNPETFKHCVESDSKLSSGVLPGEFKLYKCKNNLYDIVTPIMVSSQHVGYVFSGQFFLEDEPIDYELFRSQARKYGFNEEEYIAVLEKVPRLSRETVNTSMSFFVTFANMLSQLNYSNIKLAKSLSERNALLEALSNSEEKFRNIVETANEGIWVVDADTRATYVNKKMAEMLGYSQDEMIGRHGWDFTHEENKKSVKKSLEKRRHGVDESFEFELMRKDGSSIWAIINAKSLFDKDGTFIGSLNMLTDITERKEAEEAIIRAYDDLEVKVKQRTLELGKAYTSLKESEERLAEAQKMAHIGSYDWNITTNEEYWSDELYRIFGLDSQFKLNHNTFLNYIHPEDLENVSHSINEALNRKPYNIDYRIILPDGEERVVYSHGGVIFDEKNKPIRMRGIVQDITESKKAEEALTKLEIAQKQEIHHRIKNNLQVISSLLDLQAEKFKGRKCIEDSEVLEAFRESQDRVISMALIHEELHKGVETDTLNFSQYIVQLVDNLFLTYRLGNKNISLNMSIDEDIFFDMDTSVPLGMVVNELVSNSLKYAFVDRDKGEIRINLHREECKNTSYVLSISDNGIGIPENLDIENLDSLGLQLVTTLVDQLDGELELKRDNGTEFIIRFAVTEKNNQVSS